MSDDAYWDRESDRAEATLKAYLADHRSDVEERITELICDDGGDPESDELREQYRPYAEADIDEAIEYQRDLESLPR